VLEKKMKILEILEADKLNRHKNGTLIQTISLTKSILDLGDMYCVKSGFQSWKPCNHWLPGDSLKILIKNVNAFDDFIKNNKMEEESDDLSIDSIRWKEMVTKDGFVNFVVAGGLFTKRENSEDSDIDIFIYRDHDATVQRLISFFCELYNYRFTRRTKYLVQLESNDGDPPIQIILRKYSTIAEIIYGFDIGASQICYDGKQVYYTVLSQFAMETGLNIVDSSRLSPTYEHRLLKYHDRGFGFVYPFLSAKRVGEHPQYSILDIGNLRLNPSISIIAPNIGEEYDGNSSRCDERFSYVKSNIEYILGISDNFIADEDDRLKITTYQVDDFYEKRIDLENPNPHWFLNFDALKYKPRSREMFFYITEKKKEVIGYIKEILGQRIIIPYHWITANPGQQLSGSITPLPTNPKDYYKQYYNPLWTPETHSVCSLKLKDYMRYIYYLLFIHLIPNDVCFLIMNKIGIFYFVKSNEVQPKKRKREDDDEVVNKFKKRMKPTEENNLIIID